MQAIWRPLPVWPYEPRAKAAVPFRSGWESTLQLLEREVEAIAGDDLVIGIVCDPAQISIMGTLKAGGRTTVRHPGAEVSFDSGGRRVSFHTDAYGTLSHNLRAIAMGLEALRAVNRYGITSTGEQYAGFAQLESGEPSASRGKALVEAAGSLKEALRKHHPDQGGQQRDFVDVVAYRKAAGL